MNHSATMTEWIDRARARVNAVPDLTAHRSTIMYGWTEPEHWEWVATAPVAEIVDWAEVVEATGEAS